MQIAASFSYSNLKQFASSIFCNFSVSYGLENRRASEFFKKGAIKYAI
jgi:hypothetical protein